MLSPRAQKIMQEYLALPFIGVDGVRCPYFVNTRAERRGQIRALVGKGTPVEIVEEAKIISIQYHHGIFDHDGRCCVYDNCHSRPLRLASSETSESGNPVPVIPTTQEESPKVYQRNGDPSSVRASLGMTNQADCVRKFLIDNNLGVDCSGFVTHVLRAHFLETQNIDIDKKLAKNIPAKFLRKMIMRLRPVESIGVKSGYGNNANTQKLGDEITGYDYAKITAGDVVTMLEIGRPVIPTESKGRVEESLSPQSLRDSSATPLRGSAQNDNRKTRNHILLITECDGKIIKYMHARAWSSEGQYGHGVNTGEIKITAPDKGLLAQEWIEKSPALSADLFHQSNTNETYLEAKNARTLEIRRIKI